jgi:hypothetical protein
MLINDLVALLEDLPATLAGGWAAWLFVGLLLSVWQRRESRRLIVHGASTRQKSGDRSLLGVRAPARPVKSAPISSGDAFGDLAALLEPPTGTHREPGDSSPVLTEPSRSVAPALAAPQSLP